MPDFVRSELAARSSERSGLDQRDPQSSRKFLTKPSIVPRVTAFTAHFVRESLMSGLICDTFERQPNFTLAIDMLSECQHVGPSSCTPKATSSRRALVVPRNMTQRLCVA